jgi:hypothetical protein
MVGESPQDPAAARKECQAHRRARKQHADRRWHAPPRLDPDTLRRMEVMVLTVDVLKERPRAIREKPHPGSQGDAKDYASDVHPPNVHNAILVRRWLGDIHERWRSRASGGYPGSIMTTWLANPMTGTSSRTIQ